MKVEYKVKNSRFGIIRYVRLILNGAATQWVLNNNYVALELAQLARDAGHDAKDMDIARLLTE